MRHSPELMIYIAPTAIVGGVALAYAVKTHSIAASCIATAALVICLLFLVVAWKYMRLAASRKEYLAADAIKEQWPKELDDLILCSDEDVRIQAAVNLGLKGIMPNWPFRRDAVNVLMWVLKTESSNRRLIPSVRAALAAFSEFPDMPEILAENTGRDLYALRAFAFLLGKMPEGRAKLKELLRTQTDPEMIMVCVSALGRNVEAYPEEGERTKREVAVLAAKGNWTPTELGFVAFRLAKPGSERNSPRQKN